MLDQGLEADVQADILNYIEDLINGGLRQRLISLIKVFFFFLLIFTILRILSIGCYGHGVEEKVSMVNLGWRR